MIKKITDTEGLYELVVDISRRVVFQTHKKGLFTAEALKRLDNYYKKNVIPLLTGKKWAKHCDLREYTLGNIADEMNAHNKYCIENGMTDVALIVDSPIVKMQMNRGGIAVSLAPTAFTDTAESDTWLKEKGYK